MDTASYTFTNCIKQSHCLEDDISHLPMPFPGCMKPEGSLPYLQQPVTGLYVLSHMHVVITSYKEFQNVHFYVSIQLQDTSNHNCI